MSPVVASLLLTGSRHVRTSRPWNSNPAAVFAARTAALISASKFRFGAACCANALPELAARATVIPMTVLKRNAMRFPLLGFDPDLFDHACVLCGLGFDVRVECL